MITDNPRAFRRALNKSLYALAATALVTSSQIANAQTVLPADAKATCIVSPPEFNSWFASGSVALNGIVDPADSLTFMPSSNCSFYKWSEQMFLWLTSPAPSKYGQGSHVFNSPVFYDVLPTDASGKRTLIPNAPGRVRDFRVSIPQLGPTKKPVVFDDTGRMFTLVRPEVGPSGKPLIRNKAGQPVEIERVQTAPSGGPIFLDKTGKAIDHQVAPSGGPRLLDRSGKTIELGTRKVLIKGKSFFLDASGAVVDVEQGQAGGGGVLMAQGGSLVYYALQVNDVIAYLETGAQTGGILPTPTQFPTTIIALNKIKAFGLAHGKTFPDANALAIEVKSSWIETTGLDVSKHVTMTATIPTYTPDATNTHWVASGSKQAQLALVGMHVVGSTAGHPEMIWATFEHVNNTPNEQYTYRDTANVTKTVPKSTTGSWLFSASGATGTPNELRMSVSGANIVAATGKTIGASNILRIDPWGTAASNPQSTTNNTDIISLNNSIIGMLAGGDVRKNYIITGSTWTIGGAAPNGNQVGTNRMANSTMETFFQPSNCFSCHGTNTFSVSHIFNELKPLFP